MVPRFLAGEVIYSGVYLINTNKMGTQSSTHTSLILYFIMSRSFGHGVDL